MLAQYRSGRQAEALETYRLMRERLVEELGVDPSPTLREVHQQILDGDKGAPRARGSRAVTGSVTRHALPRRATSFVGRTQDFRALPMLCIRARGDPDRGGRCRQDPARARGGGARKGALPQTAYGCASLRRSTMARLWAMRLRLRCGYNSGKDSTSRRRSSNTWRHANCC